MSGLLPGNSRQRCDALLFQQFLPGAWVAHCSASFTCLFPVQDLQVQGHDGAGPLCAAGPIGTKQA